MHKREGGSAITHLVQLLQDRAFGAVVLEDLLGPLLHGGQLGLGLANDPIKGANVGLGGTLVEQVDVDVLGEGELAGGDGLQQGGLSAAVLTEQAIATAVVDLDGGVVEEDLAVEDQRGRGDLDIAAGLERGKHTGGDAVGDALLVLLQGELLELLLGLVNGVAGLGGFLLSLLLLERLLGGLALSSALGVASSLGSGDHGGRAGWKGGW